MRFLFLVFLLASNIVFCQPYLTSMVTEVWRSDEQVWDTVRVANWDLDEFGKNEANPLEITYDFKFYSSNSTLVQYYNSNNQIELELVLTKDQDTSRIDHYLYNANNQLKEWSWVNLSIYRVDTIDARRHLYQYYPDGRLKSEENWYWQRFSEILRKSSLNTHFYSNGSLKDSIDYKGWNSNTQTWIPRTIYEIEFYDDLGQLIEYRDKIIHDEVDEVKKLYKYDENKNLIWSNFSHRWNDWWSIPRTSDSLEYVYDSKNRIISRSDFLNNSVSKLSYQTHCNNFPETILENWEWIDLDSKNFRTTFHYSSEVFCFDLPKSQLQIYPNPTIDFLKIGSPILLSPNAKIELFDSVGRLIKIWKVSTEVIGFEVDVSNFMKGIYVISVSNETEFLSEKVIIR